VSHSMSDIQAELTTKADRLAGRGGGQTWLAWLGRAGMVAQGVMYTLVGGLAIALALGLGGKTTDQRGALHTSPTRPSPTSSPSGRV
jgi:hypothetical protein